MLGDSPLYFLRDNMESKAWKICLVLYLLSLVSSVVAPDGDDDSPVKTPTICEVCKFLVTELQERLRETGKSREVLQTGHGLEAKKRKIAYKTSELRLIEALEEPSICDKLLDYNVHAERKGSQRYAKGMSETMQTLHGLRNKGVKVELGIPPELWDKPSAEVTEMQRKCVAVVNDYEDDIQDWYFHKQDSEDLMEYLCTKRVLKGKDQSCLHEPLVPESSKTEDKSEKKKPKPKKEKGSLKGDMGPKEGMEKEEL